MMFTYGIVYLATRCHYSVFYLNRMFVVGKWVDIFIYCSPWVAVNCYCSHANKESPSLDLHNCSLLHNAILIYNSCVRETIYMNLATTINVGASPVHYQWFPIHSSTDCRHYAILLLEARTQHTVILVT